MTVVNTTDRKICGLYVSSYVLSGNGFDYNRLKPNVSDPQRTIAPNGSSKLEISTFASKPSVLAVDCDGKVVMRSFDNGSFSGTADATWTLSQKVKVHLKMHVRHVVSRRASGRTRAPAPPPQAATTSISPSRTTVVMTSAIAWSIVRVAPRIRASTAPAGGWS